MVEGHREVLLEVDDLCVNYGRIEAIRNISFTVDEGEVVTLIGTNGAGKTTTLRTISGLLRPSAGSVRYQGKRFDCGDKAGYLEAQVAFALARPDMAPAMRDIMKRYA